MSGRKLNRAEAVFELRALAHHMKSVGEKISESGVSVYYGTLLYVSSLQVSGTADKFEKLDQLEKQEGGL